MHRLNRAEYANAIRDLLALDIDATALLPPDDESSGFDNIADVLTVSPSLMERYLSASWNISRMAVGNLGIAPSTATYRVRPDLSQDQHIEDCRRARAAASWSSTRSRSTASTPSSCGCGGTPSI